MTTKSNGRFVGSEIKPLVDSIGKIPAPETEVRFYAEIEGLAMVA